MLTLIRNAWSLVHPNVDWSFTSYDNTHVTANFDDVKELTTGAVLLSGAAIDCYGWWHRTMVIDLATVKDLHRSSGLPKMPDEAPFRVGVTFEWRRGLVRLTVPDDVANRLRVWTHEHWHEFVGYGDGYSDSAEPGTWEHRTLAYLHSVQSHLRDQHVFIEGESFRARHDKNGNPTKDAYDLFVSTGGVRTGKVPTTGFHFSG